jgi:hypothetical protein
MFTVSWFLSIAFVVVGMGAVQALITFIRRNTFRADGGMRDGFFNGWIFAVCGGASMATAYHFVGLAMTMKMTFTCMIICVFLVIISIVIESVFTNWAYRAAEREIKAA